MRRAFTLGIFVVLSILLSSCASFQKAKGYSYTLESDMQGVSATAEVTEEELPQRERMTPETGVIYSKAYPERKLRKEKTGGSIDLHFESVPLSEVIKEVFGKVLGVSYVLPKPIDNPVTLHLKGVSREEATAIVKDILISLGYTTVVDNGVIKVLPSKTSPAGRNTSALVFSPQYVKPSSIPAVVKGFLSPNGKVVVSGSGVIIVDDKSRLGNIGRLLKEVDTPFYKGKSIAFIRTKLPPKQIKENVEKILALLGKSGKSSVIESLDDLGMVVVVSRDRGLFNDIRDWIELMESREAQENKRLYIIRLNYADAQDVAQLLNGLNVLEEITLIGEGKPPEATPQVPQKTETEKKPSKEVSKDKKVFQVQTLEEMLIKSKTPQKKKKKVFKGSIVADENTNSLIVKATPFQYKVLKNVISEIDRVPKQALIEMVVAEVSLGDSLKYGIEGLLKGFLDGNPFNVETSFGLAGKASALTGFKGIIFNSKGDIRGILNFLASKTKLRVLSAPHILTKDNEEAIIEVGAEVPVLSEQLISTAGGVPSVSNSIQYRPTGIILKVKPTISDSGIVTLKITEEVSDAIPNNISPDIKSPIITKRSATTTLLLKDGQVALLGGIIQNRFEDSKQGVPGVSDIPLVGEIFSSRDKSMSTTELIVLIRASVVESPEENREILSSFRRKLRMIKEIFGEAGNSPK